MSTAEDHPGVSTLVGTPKQVQDHLRKSRADQVLVLSFEHVDDQLLSVVAENMSHVATSMLELLLERQERRVVELLAEAFVPPKPASPQLLKEAAMLSRARKAVLESGDWLTAAQLAELAGLSATNPSAQPNKWKKQGLIFAIHHKGVDYFPAYGLDRNADFRPLKALAEIVKEFDGHKDAWGMAFWFLSSNSFLGGKRPQDLLATSPDRVIAAASDELREVAHG
ncbi:hypothetical protein [Burkholderia perseverans]|uniref:hypothetical protein n=1 Tax=Burkholderia perseverans TaxID=2615214 RepID=UPI001FED4BAA|nr:hypothetical protein [Burkholderia perseverans]